MRRIAELFAMLMIGEGVLTLIVPRRHSLLWEFGPARGSLKRSPNTRI